MFSSNQVCSSNQECVSNKVCGSNQACGFNQVCSSPYMYQESVRRGKVSCAFDHHAVDHYALDIMKCYVFCFATSKRQASSGLVSSQKPIKLFKKHKYIEH